MDKSNSEKASSPSRPNFEDWYQSVPPWDIGRPQQIFIDLEKQKHLRSRILDVGCGTGENALFLADKGYEIWGIDSSPTAILKASEKASQRKLKAVFKTIDALKLAQLGETFQTIIDCGLFHCFSDEERTIFVDQLYKTLTPNGLYYFLCFSDQETREGGPRRISKIEIEKTFSKRWEILSIKDSLFENTLHPGGSQGYLVSIQKQ